MPWISREHICIDCSATYWTSSNNTKRCPICAREHANAVHKLAYRIKRGKKFGVQGKHPPMSDAARFNMMMAGAFRTAYYPACGEHMKQCLCCVPNVRSLTMPKVKTWKPWK